jgi:hypothetical protein
MGTGKAGATTIGQKKESFQTRQLTGTVLFPEEEQDNGGIFKPFSSISAYVSV